MATSRPPSGGTPNFRIGVDFSVLRAAPNTARTYAQATAREISQAFRVVQNEQRLILEQARQTTAVLRAQQSQISATVRAESSIRMTSARAERVAQEQAARAATATTIEQQKRLTAQTKAEIRERERAQRQSQMSAGAFGRGAATFAGAAFGGPIGGLAGAVAGGSPALAAGLAVGEGVRFAIEGNQIATAYNRQRVAAVNLAGSQQRLNELLTAYQRAAGGAADKASALANVTRLQAVGFADNAEEVDRFTRAVRGSSIAMGRLQDEISQEVQLAISNQSLRRLDQIGLGITEVNNRIAELRANNQGMTRESAFQEAVLGLLNEKFGALADSVEGQATGIEKLTTAWKDFRLEIAQELQPNVDEAADDFTDLLNRIKEVREQNHLLQIEAQQSRFVQEGRTGISPFQTRFVSSMVERDVARRAAAGTRRVIGPEFDEDQTAALRRREEGFREIERESTLSRLEETRSYERQRSRLIAGFEQGRRDEAADFTRKRLNDERRFNMSLLDVAQDSARQRVRWAAETERNIQEASEERDERIADARTDSNKRVAEIEEKFNEDRIKRQRDFAKSIREAAANLDAVQVRELQRQRREENQEAKDARDEAIADERDSLQERIDEANKSFAEQEKDQRAALQRRIDLQKEDDDLRIQEMKDAFEEQQEQEDIERGIQLERQARNHAARLTELDLQHDERIQQIKDEAQKERDQFTEESNKFLEEVGIHNDAWLDEQEKINKGVIARHQELLDAERRALLTPGHPSLADPYADRALPNSVSPVAPSSNSNSSVTTSTRSVVIHPNAINIVAPSTFAPDERTAAWFMGLLADLFEDYPQ